MSFNLHGVEHFPCHHHHAPI